MMITVAEVYEAINNFAPFNTQLDFDNSGLLIGSKEKVVTKVAIALDATIDTVNAAADNGCQLLITHHPIIFSSMKSIDSDSVVYAAISRGLSVISAHTNLDAAVGGINDNLAKIIGLKNVASLENSGDVPMARIGKISAVSAKSFAAHLKNSIGCKGIKFVANDGPITKAAVCGGAGGDFIIAAKNAGADALVTGECKHHERLLAAQIGLGLFECGHFATEENAKSIIKSLVEKIGLDYIVIDEKDPADYL